MTSNPLLTALRQYRHNHGDGFVFGYDKEETDRVVAGLMGDRNQQYEMKCKAREQRDKSADMLRELVESLEEMIHVASMNNSFPYYPIERAEDVIRAYRKQGGEL